MDSSTLNILVALRDNDLERLSDARQAWIRAGCPDVDKALPAPSGRTFGDRLEAWRSLRNYSLRALADRAGIGPTRLFRLESGADPTLGEWYRLRKALGIVQEEDIKGMESLVPGMLPTARENPSEGARRRGRRRRSGGRP